MRAYVITTGVIFGLITIADIVRIFSEHRFLATDPIYVLLTLLSASLCIWAGMVLRKLSR
jgi:hypothetical protein